MVNARVRKRSVTWLWRARKDRLKSLSGLANDGNRYRVLIHAIEALWKSNFYDFWNVRMVLLEGSRVKLHFYFVPHSSTSLQIRIWFADIVPLHPFTLIRSSAQMNQKSETSLGTSSRKDLIKELESYETSERRGSKDQGNCRSWVGNKKRL